MSEPIAVLGAGLMGHGIAQVFAVCGYRVALYDPDPVTLATAPKRIAANLQSLDQDPAASTRLTLSSSLAEAVQDAEFVFEAAPERLSLKAAIFAELESAAPRHAILATNSSVIPVGQITATMSTDDRAIGAHWWNPPYLIDVVEVVAAKRTTRRTLDRLTRVLRDVGKEPVHIKRDVPGFVGNRLQMALWHEAFALVAEGVCDAETVDRIAKGTFGRRLAAVGPIENADYIGLDLTLNIHNTLIQALDRTAEPSHRLQDLVREGSLGAKSGRGFRTWRAGDADALRRRLIAHLNQGTT